MTTTLSSSARSSTARLLLAVPVAAGLALATAVAPASAADRDLYSASLIGASAVFAPPGEPGVCGTEAAPFGGAEPVCASEAKITWQNRRTNRVKALDVVAEFVTALPADVATACEVEPVSATLDEATCTVPTYTFTWTNLRAGGRVVQTTDEVECLFDDSRTPKIVDHEPVNVCGVGVRVRAAGSDLKYVKAGTKLEVTQGVAKTSSTTYQAG